LSIDVFDRAVLLFSFQNYKGEKNIEKKEIFAKIIKSSFFNYYFKIEFEMTLTKEEFKTWLDEDINYLYSDKVPIEDIFNRLTLYHHIAVLTYS